MDGDWLGELTAAQTVKCTRGVDTIANTWKQTHTDTHVRYKYEKVTQRQPCSLKTARFKKKKNVLDSYRSS